MPRARLVVLAVVATGLVTTVSGAAIATAAAGAARGAAPSGAAPSGGAPATAVTGPVRATASTSAAAGSPALVLEAQSAFVQPGQSFDVRVRPAVGGPPVADLALTVAVYGCLSSVSAFDQSVSSASGPAGTRIASTRTPLPLAQVPVANGVYDLSMPVAVGSTPAAPTGGFAIDLTAVGGQCGASPSGVYPVRIELLDTTSGTTLGGFTTHLVYTDPPAGTERLRLAVVLPVHTTVRPAPAPSPLELRERPDRALAPPTGAELAAVTGTVAVLAAPAHSSVPVTLEASPQTVALLASSGHQPAAAELAALSTTSPSVHEFAASPFVPVDAAGLIDAGLPAELGLQVDQGVQVLAAAGVRPSAPTGAGGARDLGAWFADDGLDPGTLGQLQTDGYDRVVLPAGDVTSAPTNGSTAEPFSVTSSKGTAMEALAFNTDLSSRFTGAPSDPVLAAHQLVAEASQMYYEKPNDTTVRGVVAVPPSGWSDSPDFVDTLLNALQSNPVLEPVTTATLFDTLGPPASCRGGCRLGSTSGSGGLPTGAIRTQRQRINGLAAAAPASRPVTVQLSEVVLSGQSENLRPAQQAATVANAGAAVTAQLAQIAVAGDRSITLTSPRGRVPVTIVSTAPYAVSALLTLSSDKLIFANHATSVTQSITLTPAHTNVVYVPVEARASGLFKVDIVLRAPTGGMVLSSGQVSVRSTATSVVGVVLSLGAVVVLVAWWIRTSRKRRRARRSESVIEEPAEPVPTG